MTEQEKLQSIADCVEMDVDEISRDTVLNELENWDSIAVLSIIAVINERFNRFPKAEDILAYKTVGELMEALM